MQHNTRTGPVAACALADVLPTQYLLLLRLELLILGSFPVCFLESAWWASQLISGLYCPGVIVLDREDGYFSLYMSGLSGRHLQCAISCRMSIQRMGSYAPFPEVGGTGSWGHLPHFPGICESLLNCVVWSFTHPAHYGNTVVLRWVIVPIVLLPHSPPIAFSLLNCTRGGNRHCLTRGLDSTSQSRITAQFGVFWAGRERGKANEGQSWWIEETGEGFRLQ